MTIRELHGWSPRTVTVDADGKVLSVSVTEPRFTRREVARLLASRRLENEPRGSHGFRMSEALDPKNAYAFQAEEPLTDFAAKALHDAQEKYKSDWPDAVMDVLRWRLKKV